MKKVLIIGIFIFMTKWNFMLSWVEHEKSFNYWYFYFYDQVKFHAQLSWAWKKFYNLGAVSHLLYCNGCCKECCSEVLPHPPYSPDLTPSDYHLFPKRKKKRHLHGKVMIMNLWLLSRIGSQGQTSDFYRNSISDLVKRRNVLTYYRTR